MPIRLYNTLTGQKEDFAPRDDGKASIYACGLTPQGPAHLGHLRGAVAFDVIRRWLTYRNYDVTFVQNFTDIDDKIIAKSAEEGVPPAELALRYANAYLQDWDALGIERAVFVKVTENMDAIISLVSDLVSRGHAYPAANGDVYFDVSSDPEYGKLSHRRTEELSVGARIALDEAKDDPLDFALWKAAKPGEPSWESPWGLGRPGWHIECSALALKYLGNGFDIHAGGIDLVFPHHENEIAQSECATGQIPFANVWMHWGAVNTGGVKMSKSLGNFFTIREILDQYPPAVVRLYVLSTLYRSPIEYQPERLADSAKAYERIRTALTVAEQIAGAIGIDADATDPAYARFAAAMDDDFNTAQALGVVFELVAELNRLVADPQPDPSTISRTATLIRALLAHLGIAIPVTDATHSDELAPALIEQAILWRQDARAAKQYVLSDRIRDDLKTLGIVIEDRPQGTTWRRE